MKEVTLNSGATLKMGVVPFVDAKAFYQAVLEEARSVSISEDQEIGANLIKDLFCTGFSSKKIDSCLKKCMDRCLYNGIRITDETWEPMEAREDYLQVCIEVAKETLAPFVKSLYAEFSTVMPMILGDLQLRQKTTHS